MHNRYNLVGLGLRFESNILENVVNQMNDIIVQFENHLHDSTFDRVAEIKMHSVKHMLIMIENRR